MLSTCCSLDACRSPNAAPNVPLPHILLEQGRSVVSLGRSRCEHVHFSELQPRIPPQPIAITVLCAASSVPLYLCGRHVPEGPFSFTVYYSVHATLHSQVSPGDIICVLNNIFNHVVLVSGESGPWKPLLDRGVCWNIDAKFGNEFGARMTRLRNIGQGT